MENTIEEKGLQLADLKVSNLPELQGWKEKQEALVEENPYVEVTDNKSYEVACKSRTALLKGRTALESQDKLIASKLTSFRKEVKDETDKLVAITKPHEEKQQTEVKRYEGIKEAEKAEKDRLEKVRVDTINAKIEEFETESLKLIQGLTFGNISGTKDALNLLAANASEFDFEEFDILLENVKSRNQTAFDTKHASVVESENQRLENERLAKIAEDAAKREKLQSDRLTELFPFNRFGADVDMPTLWALSESEYQSVLKSKKDLFDAEEKREKEDQKIIDDAKAEADAKAKEVADKMFAIRGNRLAEIGVFYTENTITGDMLFADLECSFELSKGEVYYADAVEFETILSDAKVAVEALKTAKEAADRKKVLDEENARFEKRKQILIDLGFCVDKELNTVLTIQDVWSISSLSIKCLTDSDFDETLVSIKHAIAQKNKEVADAAKKANEARVEVFTSDKKSLRLFVEELEFHGVIPEVKNSESEEFLQSCFLKLMEFKKGLLTEIENL